VHVHVEESGTPLPIGRIWRIENRQKWIRIEKVRAPQTRGSQELNKNKPPNTTKPIPHHPNSWVYMVT